MKFVGGTIYTYVEIEMFPFHRMVSEKPRTKYIRNEFDPVFNDEVCITINKEEVDDQKMYLHVCDYNQISTRDLIGSYKMDLNDVSFKAKGKPTVYEKNLQWIDSVSKEKRNISSFHQMKLDHYKCSRMTTPIIWFQNPI